MSFELNAAESSLRCLLLDVAAYINPNAPSDLRFTGGWVRDKLLGIQSHDIDVGINDMTGFQFGLRMKEFLALPGNETKFGAEGIAANLHKIEANPEKSKHLETVTTKIFGLDVDLVNLRKETYTEESRNPQMEFGTPQEDALRRDATINAMFYNLKTQEVEDFTGRGYDDLEYKIIRTPLEPYQTFKDDPLRVLRLIRFASRFEYTLDPEAEEAMGDAGIRKALRLKISRERVGIEVEKMLKGPHPLMSLSLIDRLGLFSTIFVDPEHDYNFQPEVETWKVAYKAASQIIEESESRFEAIFRDNVEQPYLTWILTAIIPWADVPVPQQTKSGGKKPLPGVNVVRNGLKASNKVSDVVNDAILHVNEIIQSKDEFLKFTRTRHGSAEAGSASGRDTLGMLIRKWGKTWKSQVAFAIMLDSVRAAKSDRDVFNEHATFLSHISKLELLEAPEFKPIVDGKTLANELHVRPGPWMKTALDEIIAWQLRHPEDATAEGAIDALRSKHGELPSRLITHFLTLTIRPLFAQTRTQTDSKVTRSGHRSLNDQSTGIPLKKRVEIETFEEEEARRPWKREENEYCLQLLEWCIKALQAGSRRTEKNWPQLVPAVLALIDDVDVAFKCRGCFLLAELLRATEPTLLQRTGLGQVFQEAVTPCLSYLPTLTPQDESIELLNAAYPCLFTLANVRYPRTQKDQQTNLAERERMLAHVLHHHLLRGFLHVEPEEYPALTSALLVHLASLASEMRITVIPQLRYALPVISSVLVCTLGIHAPDMLAQAARTLQNIIAQSWPRIWRWRGEVLKGVCVAWLNLNPKNSNRGHEKLSADVQRACNELQVVLKMLVSAINAFTNRTEVEEIHFEHEIENLKSADSRLGALFEAVHLN